MSHSDKTISHVKSIFEIDDREGYERFFVKEPVEINYVLRSLMNSGVLMNAHVEPNNDSFITTLLSVDDKNARLVIDSDKSDVVNRHVLQASRLIVGGHINQVKTQFILTDIRSVEFDGSMSFSVGFPVEILRLQRREYFRQAPPVIKPLRCLMHIPEYKPLQGELADLRVADISRGGISLALEHDDPLRAHFKPDKLFLECKLQLPNNELILNLRVRNTFDVESLRGTEFVRIGCEYVDIIESKLSAIQRYVLMLERERKSRIQGG